MTCACSRGPHPAFELFEKNWHKKQPTIEGGLANVYNIGATLVRAVCIGQRSDFDACAVRLGGSPLYTLSVGSPLILSPTSGPLEVSPFPYELDSGSGKPGALSLELYDYVPSWIHDRRRGPAGVVWQDNSDADAELVNAIDSTSEQTWFYVPTYGRRKCYLWFAGNLTNDTLNDNLDVRIEAVSVTNVNPLNETQVDQHYSPVWPDANDGTVFETISGSQSSRAAKAVIDVEGWELLRVRAKKAADANAEAYGFKWLAVD